MVAIVTGNGLGLERSSAWVLGSRGQLGQADLGRADENVYVNAANGNLVIRDRDEMLIGVGLDSPVERTYNSQGAFTDDNGDNWRAGAARQVKDLIGPVNTGGSAVTRVDWDGSEVLYVWSGSRNAYVSKEGAGAYDTLTFGQGKWTWTDGDTRMEETYDPANGGRITQSKDADGNALTFDYGANGLVSKVTTASGEWTIYGYSGNQLTSAETHYRLSDGGANRTRTRIYYGYDTQGRLSTVTVDLSQSDGSTADGNTYVTSYSYVGSSKRVSEINQDDGSRLHIDYVPSGGAYRVSQLTQTSANGVTRTTGFAYQTNKTVVTDAFGQTTELTYSPAGDLLSVKAPPAISGAAAQLTQFEYNDNGDIIAMTSPSGAKVNYRYDVNGNREKEWDSAGNHIDRAYNELNQLVAETRYLAPDPDGGGSATAGAPVTTRFTYDGARLRFVVSDDGRVTQFKYDSRGQRTDTIEYTADRKTFTDLTQDQAPTLTRMENWVDNTADKSAARRTETSYDHRGGIDTVTTYARLKTAGSGDDLGEVSRLKSVYDPYGNLLSRQELASGASEVFVYDGLQRLTSATDFNGVATSTEYQDKDGKTVVHLAGGLVRTLVHNRAGELAAITEGGGGLTDATTSYRYDSLGRLRSVTDATGVKDHVLYDGAGRKVADVEADGTLTEYGYDADDQLVRTVRYRNTVSATALASLSDVSGNPTATQLSDIRPSPSSGSDRWEWRVYDEAHRLVQSIDAAGAVTAYSYDGASRLTRVTAYATTVATAGLKSTQPTTPVAVTANSANDRVTRNFYDDDGSLIGALDGEGGLTQHLYDGANQKVETIRYANDVQRGGSLRESGSFSDLIANVGVSDKDIHEQFLHDARGLLVAAIDGEGDLTRYHYTAMGFVDQEVRGQKVSVGTSYTPTTLPAAGAGVVLETTNFSRDLYGRVLSESRILPNTNGETGPNQVEITSYAYNPDGQLIGKTVASGTSDARSSTFRYDA